MLAFPIVLGATALRKLVGVYLGRRLLHESQNDELRAVRLRYGRFNFSWVSGSLSLVWFSYMALGFKDGLQERALETIQSSLPSRDLFVLLQTWRVVVPLLVIGIPIVEFWDRRQWRASALDEDIVEARRPPFQLTTLFAWWSLVTASPFVYSGRQSALVGTVIIFIGVVGFAVSGLTIWWFEQRAKCFELSLQGPEATLIERVAKEVGTPIRRMEVVAADRTYAKATLTGVVLVSTEFEKRYTREQREALLRFELAMAHPRFRWTYVGFASVIAICLMSGLARFPLSILVMPAIIMLVYGTIEALRLKWALGQVPPESKVLVASYRRLRPSLFGP